MSFIRCLAFAAAIGSAASSRAAFFVAHDTAAGTNQGHVTLLYDHGDHFHRIGVFGGAIGQVPEASAGGPLKLAAGTGSLAGRYVSTPYLGDLADPTAPYSNTSMTSIWALSGGQPGSAQAVLFNSSGGRYQGSLAGTSLALELIAISAGLNLADAAGAGTLNSPGSRIALGAGDGFGTFLPRFFTDAGVAAGSSYSASFKLVDLNGVAQESGQFRYVFQAVPEPSSFALAGLGLGAFALVGRRRRGATAPIRG